MKRSSGSFIVFICIWTFCGMHFSFGAPIHEGQWEITTVNDIQGLPPEVAGFSGQKPTVTTQCLTEQNQVGGMPKDKKCDFTQGWDGNMYTCTGTCEDGTSVDVQLTYSGDTMQGMVITKGEGMAMNIKITGRYLGPCPTN
ncbi:MAG: DUF3617 family protein [Candidatus Omnitrophica bacterium]|nr:DUF3617 family protein [Candidatus Omnitrophota bacterium]